MKQERQKEELTNGLKEGGISVEKREGKGTQGDMKQVNQPCFHQFLLTVLLLSSQTEHFIRFLSRDSPPAAAASPAQSILWWSWQL